MGERSASAFIILALSLLLVDSAEWSITKAAWLLMAAIYLFVFTIRAYMSMRDR